MGVEIKGPNEARERFAAQLRGRLIEKYGQLPSAEAVARDFNLNAWESKPILRETARRWMRGLLMPKTDQILVLSRWLALDFFSLVSKSGGSAISGGRGSDPVRRIAEPTVSRGPALEDVNEIARMLAMENIDQLMQLLAKSKAWLAAKP